jgi:hypothetical protein
MKRRHRYAMRKTAAAVGALAIGAWERAGEDRQCSRDLPEFCRYILSVKSAQLVDF